MVKQMLAAGADPNWVDRPDLNNSCLIDATHHGNPNIVQ